MVEACEGTLGAGKTFYTVTRMGQQIARGGMVFTNVDVRWDKWECGLGFREFVRRRFGKEPVQDQLVLLAKSEVVDFDQYIKWGTDELNVLLVLDEIHLWFDQYQGKEFSKRLMAFLTQSRKCNVDIIFISQDILNVAVQFRRMLQYVWRFRDLATWTIPGFGALPFCTGKLLGVCLDRDGKTVMRRVCMSKDQLVFGAYKSKAIVTGLEVPVERAQVFKLEDYHAPKFWESWNRRSIIRFSAVFGMLLVFAMKVVLWLNF